MVNNDFNNTNFSKFKIDIIGAKVFLAGPVSPLNVWSCYISSNINIPIHIWHTLLSLVRSNSLLGGDFNAFHRAWGSPSVLRCGNRLYNSVCSLGLCILNDDSPTHLGHSGVSDSAINLSFCSPNPSWKLCWSNFDNPHSKDHFLILISLTFRLFPIVSHSPGTYSNAKYNDSTKFKLNKVDWAFVSLLFSLTTPFLPLLLILFRKMAIPLSQILSILPLNVPSLLII